MKKRFNSRLLWSLPLLTFALDANAWGLLSHLHFTQHLLTQHLLTPHLLLLSPLLDPSIRRAAKRFPQLVMAGACLPDLALVSRRFNTTHQWQKAEAMMALANTDEEVAIVLGYSSHLYVDVIAHNHFVPAFEAKWLNKTVFTHIAAEWAMDAHIAKHGQEQPYTLIIHNLEALSAFVASCFKVSRQHARTKLKQLAWADKALRFSALSTGILWLLKRHDAELVKNLDYYLNKTYSALHNFNQFIQGFRPHLAPELTHLNTAEMVEWRKQCLTDLHMHLATPLDFYRATQHYKETRHPG